MGKDAKKLGRNLKRIRNTKNITQGDIVRALGVGRGYISNVENGKANPTLETIAKIAKALKVKIEELVK
jgi:transcriptional regulator with XRE-family HTH domain